MTKVTEPRFDVTFTCESGHAQTIQVKGMDGPMVRMWAGLVDGTSPLYTIGPRDKRHVSAVIGRCATCAALIADTTIEAVKP